MTKRKTGQFKGDNLPVDIPDNEIDLADLREGQEGYRLLKELTGDGIIIVKNGTIIEYNPSMAKMCGYGQDELAGACLAGFFRSDDIGSVESLCGDALKTENTPASLEATLVCKNDHRLIVEITAARCTYQQRPAVFLVIRDVSQRRDVKADQKNIRRLDSIAISRRS